MYTREGPLNAAEGPVRTVSFHNFKSQNFKLSVSNPKNKDVAYLSVLSQISNCQGLGRKNKHETLKTDRTRERPLHTRRGSFAIPSVLLVSYFLVLGFLLVRLLTYRFLVSMFANSRFLVSMFANLACLASFLLSCSRFLASSFLSPASRMFGSQYAQSTY